MVVDVLTMLDGTLKGSPSRDVSSRDEREESFGTIFEERMKADNAKPERAGAKHDKEPRGTNQVKPQSAEDNSENKPEEVAQTVTGKSDATEEETAVAEKIVNKETSDNEIQLTEEQLTKLAAMMGISMEEMAKLELLLEGKAGELVSSLSDDMRNRLAKLLDSKIGGDSRNQTEAVAKLAELLDMDKEEAETLFKQLRVISMEIKEGDGKSGKVLTDAQKGDSKTQDGNANLDAEFDELLNAAKKSGGHVKAEVSSAADHSGKKAQLNSSAQTVETNAVNVVKSDRSGVTQTAAVKESAEISYKTTENRVIDQIIEKVKILSFPKSTHAKIALKPPSLGWIDIKIVMHETGARTTIVVESAAVKQLVDQSIDELKAALNQQGISVEEMNVSVEQQDARSSKDGGERNDDGHRDFNEVAEDSHELHLDGIRLADELVKAAYNSHLNITV